MEQCSNESPQIITEVVTPVVVKQKKEHPLNITSIEALILLAASAMIALLYALCFNGWEVKSQLSFTLFSMAAFVILSTVLTKLNYFKNKKALKWGIPIIGVSMFNGIFHENFFTYTNIIVVHGLFAIFTISAMQSQPQSLLNLNGFKKIFGTIFSNWLVFAKVFKKVGENKSHTVKSPTAKKIAAGFCLAIPVMIVLITLLASADMVFDRLIGCFFHSFFDFKPFNISFIITFLVVWVFSIGYVIQGKRNNEKEYTSGKSIQVDVIMGATFLVMVNLVFAVFSVTQVAFLFRGGFMTLPKGIVYSEYAREGFFQLLLVTMINFSVIIIFMSFFKSTTSSKLLRILLLTLCLFTGVLIISSFYRMFLYIDVYGHTTLRLSVITFLVMEVFLIAITVAKLFNERINFAKWFVATCFAFYLIVNITGSNYVATQLNINRVLAKQQKNIDMSDCNVDGLYLVRTYMEHGKLEQEQLSNADWHEPEELEKNPSLITDYETFVHWQNWSLLKARSFKNN